MKAGLPVAFLFILLEEIKDEEGCYEEGYV